MPRLLVIDDEVEPRSVLVEILEAEGYEVDSVGDGATGVARARQRPPDLIICDIRMDGLDGYGVLAALREDPMTAIIPVIFLTAVAESGAVRKGMELGADDYLAKPVGSEEILRAIRARLARQGEVRREFKRRLDRLRSDLAQSLPHEFLTPLTAVMGLSSLLMDDDGSLDAGAVREVARGIFVGSEKLQAIITKFLLYAELEAAAHETAERPGKTGFTAEHAAPVVEEAVRAKAARMGRQADVEISVEDASIPVLRDHLRQVVEELVENALEFSAPGSPVSVRGNVEGDAYILSVADAGRGMTADQVQGLEHYAPLRRHQDQPGLGLGLAIVRRVAQNHGGQVAFDTEPGKGTTLQVRLPLRRS